MRTSPSRARSEDCEMASMTFTRWDGGKPAEKAEGVKNEIRFDSSPKFSICKQFGFYEDSYRQVETSSNSEFTTYDIYGSNLRAEDREDLPVPMVGVLVAKTRTRILAEQDRR